MNSREAILQALRTHKPAATPAPEPLSSSLAAADPAAFAAAIATARGRAEQATRAQVAEVIARVYPQASVASLAPGIVGLPALPADAPIEVLAGIDVLVLEGELGVVENGAIWVPESRMGHRAAPFLAQHLVIVLDSGRLVEDMHGAYASVHIDAEGFGAFIAGPSKTADIEQSLVLGAHGPRSLLVVLV